ncbi:MAG: nitrophenyl compound nitroreductase subunit ArsF family protein [Ignavibacteriae bacterium]|nr:nitrophenyl compound nitroreductase subunit ArsF family protein [Ignavibacteriota bacterium]
MKTNKTMFLVFILFIEITIGCGKKEETKIDRNPGDKYVAYYFHPTARCESCINMENYLKEIIENKYEKDGFQFKEVNVDLSENEHFKKDFELKFSSVIILNLNNNKWKNLDSIWSYTDNKEKFIKYADNEISNFIKSN